MFMGIRQIRAVRCANIMQTQSICAFFPPTYQLKPFRPPPPNSDKNHHKQKWLQLTLYNGKKKMQRVQIIFRNNRYYFQQKLFPNIWLAIKCSISDYEYIMNFPIFIVYTMQQINIYSVILNIATIETLLFLVAIFFKKNGFIVSSWMNQVIS